MLQQSMRFAQYSELSTGGAFCTMAAMRFPYVLTAALRPNIVHLTKGYGVPNIKVEQIDYSISRALWWQRRMPNSHPDSGTKLTFVFGCVLQREEFHDWTRGVFQHV